MNYAARVSLDRAQMQVDEKLANLSPSMAVTVEIKTGSRRIISYLLSPVLRYKRHDNASGPAPAHAGQLQDRTDAAIQRKSFFSPITLPAD